MEHIDDIIIRYISGGITSEEEILLFDWLEKSEENRKYFRSLKDTYDLGQLKDDLHESRVEEQWNKFKQQVSIKDKNTGRKISLFYSFVRYVAIFLLGWFGFQAFLHIAKSDPVITQTLIETGVGDRSMVTLPDGSNVWINACSSVSYDNTYGQTDRRVSLQGEAFFKVNSDTLKPFLVQADIFTYRVTGTSFNVYSFTDENEITIALLEGGVTIEYNEYAEKLFPGEIFIYDKITGEPTRKSIDINRLGSWRNGELIFDNMTFEELAKRLERSFNVKFVFEKENIKRESFGGSFRNYESLDTILKVISTSIRVNYKIEEDIVYIK